jgi:hypothetical protein
LILEGDVRISEHGYDELVDDHIAVRDIINGVANAEVVEEYPEYPKGAALLLLLRDQDEFPVHVVWGIPKGFNRPAVLVTAYRPDPERWEEDFSRRKKK